MMDDATRLSRCVRCGAALPLDAADDLCPSCRQSLAAAPTILGGTDIASDVTIAAPTMGSTAGDDATVLSPLSAPGGWAAGPSLVIGQAFGPYRIERLLGRGGMGDVYEAEHVEHDRRVALKLLNQRLATAEDRARFLREGELAASITHPNTVYIFGSEEITAAPVITMELLSGGTLKDLVQDRGPLPAREAVDLILQVIAGLEAAHATGILHRDIKPANCFIDRDGAVKVGDFGLSISTHGREGAATGMFQGTPQFAAPEQLRGEALDVRADIYAVGATLFYLLTGQPPFDDQDLTTLITRVKAEVPQSPRAMRASVPQLLANVVMRCLAKNRDDRPATYAILEDHLRSFSSSAPTPAPIGRRVLGGLIDQMLVSTIIAPVATFIVLQQGKSNAEVWLSLVQVGSFLVYFGVLEGRWGAAIGKRILGLCVVRLDGQRPGLARSAARAAIFQTPSLIGLLPMVIFGMARVNQFGIDHPVGAIAISIGSYAILALLFSTARRRNGFAAMHDLASGTRVVRRIRKATRAVMDMAPDAVPATGAHGSRYGHFDVVGTLGRTDEGELLVAFDPRLKRAAWIHDLPPGVPAIAPLVRDLKRPGRLRWLGGRRTATESWDAYEAVNGQPLVRLESPHPWRVVKRWLLDLAIEVDGGLQDASLPALTLDRVWVTRAGHAKLLDFRAPGAPVSAEPGDRPTLASAQPWLTRVAGRGLAGPPPANDGKMPPLPRALSLGARTVLERLALGKCASAAEVVTQLRTLQAGADEVAPWRRAASVAVCGVAPLLFGVLGVIAAIVMRNAPPDLEALALCLRHVKELPSDGGAVVERERQALETYIASRFSTAIASDATWIYSFNGQKLMADRPLAQQIVARHPQVSQEDLQTAMATLAPFLQKEQKALNDGAIKNRIAPTVVPVALVGIGLGIAAGFGVMFALFFRGGLLLRGFGIAVVNRRGAHASRLRTTLRAAAAWAPAGIALYFTVVGHIQFTNGAFTARSPAALVAAGVSALIFLAGALFAALHPTRGIQDYLAGSQLVPR